MAKIDHAERMSRAREVVLRGLARDDDVFELRSALVELAIQGDLVLAETLIRLASNVIGLGGFSPGQPLEYEGFREKFLPELEFRGKVDHRNSQYAIYAAAIMRGGMTPDVVADTGWWRSELWPYALYALVAYVRAAAERRGLSTSQIATELAQSAETPVHR